jgi:hypothetical protein
MPVQGVSKVLDTDPETAFGAIQVDPQKTILKRRKGVSQPKETSLQLLHRLFGKDVYDLFPESLMDSVNKAHAFWLANPDPYLVTEFDTAKEAADCLALMRAYAEIAEPEGYTIRQDKDSDPNVLYWKATKRIRRQGRTDDGDDE